MRNAGSPSLHVDSATLDWEFKKEGVPFSWPYPPGVEFQPSRVWGWEKKNGSWIKCHSLAILIKI